MNQTKMIPLSYADQVVEGSFEYALNEIVEEHLDLSVFEHRYHNDATGRSAYDPRVLLKIVLYGWVRYPESAAFRSYQNPSQRLDVQWEFARLTAIETRRNDAIAPNSGNPMSLTPANPGSLMNAVTSLLPTDFVRDIQIILRQRLDELGITVDPSDPRPIEIIFEAALLKRIRPTLRKVHKPLGFQVPPELQENVAKLQELIEQGKQLLPHQIKAVSNSRTPDGLLNAWGIYHLHLSFEEVSGDIFNVRTREVLLAMFRDEDAYFLDILPHGKGNGDLWGRTHLLEIVARNWPELVAQYKTPLTPAHGPATTPQEHISARKGGVSPLVEVLGVVYVSPGGGIATDGTNRLAVSGADRLVEWLNGREAECRENFEAYARYMESQGFELPALVDLRLRLVNNELQASVVGSPAFFPMTTGKWFPW